MERPCQIYRSSKELVFKLEPETLTKKAKKKIYNERFRKKIISDPTSYALWKLKEAERLRVYRKSLAPVIKEEQRRKRRERDARKKGKKHKTEQLENPYFPEVMKAVRVAHYGGEENLELHDDVPIPKTADDEVLIKVKAAGVNPVDVLIRLGLFTDRSVPYTPGCDGSGVVQEVGSAIKKFSKGDKVHFVFSSGSYAEYATAKEIHVNHLSECLSFEQGASIGVPYYAAYAAIHFRARTQPAETVLIHGASGAVGTACIQILKALGCRIIGTAGTTEGLDHVKNHGADFSFNHHDKDYMNKIKNGITGGYGVDVILEMMAHANLQADMEIMAHRGRTVIIGTQTTTEIDPLLLLQKESLVIGENLYATQEMEWKNMHAALSAGQALGWLKPYVGKKYSMAEAGKAHYDIVVSSGVKGNLVINTLKQ